MRPNLMSPRRTSGEDSILAMLERDPARQRGAGGAASRTRLAWYGAGAAVAMALTGTLVWLAAGNDGLHPDLERRVMAESRTAPPAAERPALVQVALSPEAAPAPRQGSAAVIVDQRPADAVPPLRLLKPAPATQAAAPARPTAPPAPAPAPAKPAAKAPGASAKTAASTAAPTATTAATATPARIPAAGAPAARPRPVTVTRNVARPAPSKPQRPGATRPADGPVDPDVALISAVIVHANGHAPEGSQMTELLCPNDSCQARPARQ